MDHIGISIDHFACNFVETSRLILPPINDEVYTFDVAEALEFFQENCCIWIAPDPRIFDLPNDNDCEAFLRGGLLRVCRRICQRKVGNHSQEVAALHLVLFPTSRTMLSRWTITAKAQDQPCSDRAGIFT